MMYSNSLEESRNSTTTTGHVCDVVFKEEDELALMAMMGEYIDYVDDWIIDSGCSNHMTDNQSGATEAGWPSEDEVLQDLDNVEKILLQNTGEQTKEILPQKMGEQIVHICLSADVPGDPSNTNDGEQEMTQLSEPSENEMTPQQLRWSEIILKPNLEYVNAVEDEINELSRRHMRSITKLRWAESEGGRNYSPRAKSWELVPRPEDTRLNI